MSLYMLCCAGYNNDTSLFTGRGANGDMVTEYGFVYSKKFKTAGTFPYKCHNHGEQMYGVITVVPKKGEGRHCRVVSVNSLQ